MQTIDSLGIEITADSQGANNALKDVTANLKNVKDALKGFNNSNFKEMASSMQQVKNAVDLLTTKIKVLNSMHVKLDLDTSGINKSTKFINNSADSIRRELAGLKPIANAALSGDSSAVSSFQRKAMSIQSSIEKIKSEFAKMGDTKIDNPELIAVRENIEKTTEELQKYKAEASNITPAMQENNPIWDELQEKIRQTELELARYKQTEESIINSGQEKIDPLQSARDSISETEAGLQKLSSQVDAAASKINKKQIKPDTKSGELAIESYIKTLSKLKSAFSSALGGFSKLGGKLIEPFKKAKSGLESIKNAFDKVHNFLDKGFMKILRYGFGIRSLYVLFRRLKEAIKDSFVELQKSGAFVQETKANIEGLKNALTTLKFQFGAAFQPIFNAIAPALQTLINYLVSVMNILSAFTAKLMGKSTYSKAVASSGAIASNMGSAAGSAKELNKQLQGFDELNNLTSNSPGGGGGGGGGGGAGSGANYVTESVDSILGDFANELIDKIRAGDWKGVGQAISDKLSEAMESIPWNKIYKKAENFGTGLAQFLNGLITPRLFGNVGKTIANSLNTAFLFLNSFGKEFDWKNFGNSIATGINDFFKNADFAMWGDTVHTWIGGILDAGIELLDKTDFEQIGTKLADFINNLDPIDLLSKIAVFIHKLLNGIKKLLASLWQNLNSDIKKGIKDYIVEALSWMPSNLPLILAWSNYLADFANSVLDGIKATFKAIGEEIKKSINKLLFGGGTTTGYNGMPSDVANNIMGDKGLSTYGENIINGIKKGFTNLLDKFDVVQKLYDKIKKDFQTIFDMFSPAKAMFPFGANILYGILKGYLDALKKKGGEFINKLWDLFRDNDNGGSKGNKQSADFEITLSGVVDSIPGIDNLKSKYNLLKTAWQGRTSEFKTKMTGVIKSIDETLGLTEKFGNLRKGWEGASATFTTAVGGSISNIKDLTVGENSWLSRINKLIAGWKKGASAKFSVKSVFNGKSKGIGNLNDGDSSWLGRFNTLYNTWSNNGKNNKTASASFNASFDKTAKDLGDYASAMSDLQSNWKGASAEFSASASITATVASTIDSSSLSNTFAQVNEAIERWLRNNPNARKFMNAKGPTVATGGIITPYGFQTFANGGRPHGTMFLAGEAGPEIVGHVGGRTEVLNKSQLASTMVAATRSGMVAGLKSVMPLEFKMNGPMYANTTPPESLKYNTSNITANGYSANSNYDSNSIAESNYLMQEQIRQLEEQNRLLQIIADKDPNIKVKDVFDATRKGATEYYNRTGNSPFLF